jgi:hypothetical protein
MVFVMPAEIRKHHADIYPSNGHAGDVRLDKAEQ